MSSARSRRGSTTPERTAFQFSGAEGGTSEYLKDRARNVETWDGDNG